MTRPIAISLSPNTERNDVWFAIKTLLNPLIWKQKKYTKELESEFSKLLGSSYKAYALNSGRSAFYVGLKALGLSAESEVVIQAFTCVVVPNAIMWAGLKPKYVDIDSSYNVDPKHLKQTITKKTRAVVVQHTFGVPADIKRIKKVIQGKEKEFGTKIYLIEDCAHALGAVYGGKVVGTFSDFAFFSFGRDKILSSVFGGMLTTNNKKLQKEIEREYSDLKQPSVWWIKQQLVHPVLFNVLILPMYTLGVGKATVGKVLLYVLQKFTLLSKPVYEKELNAGRPRVFPKLMPGALARLALFQLPKLNRYNKARKAIASQYIESGLGSKSMNQKKGCVWLRYPISVDNPESLLGYAKKRGMVLGNWYHSVLDPTCDLSDFDYVSGSCPNAEKLANRIVNLPTYPLLSKHEVKDVISLVKTWQHIHTKK